MTRLQSWVAIALFAVAAFVVLPLWLVLFSDRQTHIETPSSTASSSNPEGSGLGAISQAEIINQEPFPTITRQQQYSALRARFEQDTREITTLEDQDHKLDGEQDRGRNGLLLLQSMDDTGDKDEQKRNLILTLLRIHGSIMKKRSIEAEMLRLLDDQSKTSRRRKLCCTAKKMTLLKMRLVSEV